MYLSSPLEQFEVLPLLELKCALLHAHITFTNLSLFIVICTCALMLVHSTGMNGLSLGPSRVSLCLESVYHTIQTMVRDQIGMRNEVYFPFIYALFTFILLCNLLGNVTYCFTVSTSAVVSIGISLMIFLGVTSIGITRHGIHFLSFFVPAGSPLALVPALICIELMSYLARAVSLGVRLFANMTAGHSLLVILSGFLYAGFTKGALMSLTCLMPFLLFLSIVGLELGVSAIQAYV